MARTDIPATVRWDYGERVPLAQTWADSPAAARERALDYWIAKAARDPWAYGQLLDLAAQLVETGEDMPAALRSFMLAHLRGKSAPPKGWKSDPTQDVRIAALVHVMGQLGIAQREAFGIIGNALNLSPKTIESARRRGLGV